MGAAGLGLVLMATGGGLVWAGRGSRTVVPDTIPESFVTDRIDGNAPAESA